MLYCYFRAAAPESLTLVDKDPVVVRKKRQLCPNERGMHTRG